MYVQCVFTFVRSCDNVPPKLFILSMAQDIKARGDLIKTNAIYNVIIINNI